jgi:hypothetical protein
LNAAKSTVEQNRLDEIRLTKEAVKVANQRDSAQQVGPGMPLPERGSSLMARENGNNSGQQRSKRENGRADVGNQPKPSKSSKQFGLPSCHLYSNVLQSRILVRFARGRIDPNPLASKRNF